MTEVRANGDGDMSATEHTPGPWRTMWGQDTMAVEAADDRIVASADFDDDDYGVPYDECKANIRLIAASPDLLAVVELLTRNHDVESHLSWDRCDCEIAVAGRAAIAKAKGGGNDNGD